jgi:hypothetical protein
LLPLGPATLPGAIGTSTHWTNTSGTGDQGVELGRGEPVALAQRLDDALDDRPIRLQQIEGFVLRALDDDGNILLGDAPDAIGTSINWTSINWVSVERDRAVLVAADRQASLKASYTDSVPGDTGPASGIYFDIGRWVTSKPHFRDQAGNGEHQVLVQVTGKDGIAATIQGGIRDRQQRRQGVVADDGVMGGAASHVDPNAGEAEQPGDDRVPGLVIGDLTASLAGVDRAGSSR